MSISWSPDSRRLAYVSIDKKFVDEARASGKGTSHKRAGADMFIVDVDGDRVPRRVAGAPNLYLSDSSPPRWADDGIALSVIGRDYQVWTIDSRNMTSTPRTKEPAQKNENGQEEEKGK